MKIKLSVIVAIVAIFFSGITYGQTVKIGYTDVNYLLTQLPEYKQIETELKTYETQLQNQLKSKYKDYQDKAEALQKGAATMTEVVRNDKMKEIQNLENSIREFEQNASTSFEQKKNSLFQPQFERIQKAIDDVAVENEYNFILAANVEGMPVILANPGEKDNVSDLILNKLKVAAPVTTTPVTPNTTPTKTPEKKK